MSNKHRRRGLMLVLSSPSGAGKSTLSRLLLDQDDQIAMSVSATTRLPRPGEVEGQHYYFKSPDEFEAMVQADQLLEHADVFGNRYGTPRGPVEDSLRAGRDVLFDIDWQGRRQLSDNMNRDLVSVFILPPSIDELERRLHNRAQDSEDVIQHRMAGALGEIIHWFDYDYNLVNDELETCLAELKAILKAERLKRYRQPWLYEFVNEFRK